MMKMIKTAALALGVMTCSQSFADAPAPVPSNKTVLSQVDSVRWTGDSLWITGGGKKVSVFAREANDEGKRAMAMGCLKLALYAKSARLSFIVEEEKDRDFGNGSVGPGGGTWYCEVK